MGSYEMAYVTGFLCRLCSEMHRTVIHIYGDVGRQQQIAQKINDYLPVTVSPSDPLPKTICKTCLSRVEQHHDLIQTMRRGHAFAHKAMAAHKAAKEAEEAAKRTQSGTANAARPVTPRSALAASFAAPHRLDPSARVRRVPPRRTSRHST